MKFYRSILNLASVLAIAGVVSTSLSAKTYDIDPAHSDVTFKIRHLLSNVSGRFDKWEGKFEVDEKTGALVNLEASVQTASINTNNKKRDDHLKSEDFFAADKFPDMKFISDKVNLKPNQLAKVPGQLTLHGITKAVVWEVEYLGTAKDPSGNDKAALSARIPKLSRKDFGLTWNKPLEKAGGMLIGDDVWIEVNAEGNLSKTVSADQKKDAPSSTTKK